MKYFCRLIVFAAVLVAAAQASAQQYCKDLKRAPTRINIRLLSLDPVFDFTRSKRYLTSNSEEIRNARASTKEQRAWVEKSHTAGLARGGLGFSLKGGYNARQYAIGSNYYCPFFDVVDIEVFYSTNIYVAREYKEGTCEFKSILGHEFMHHDINLAIVGKYISELKKNMPTMMREVEAAGYVVHAGLQPRFDNMTASLKDAVDVYMEQIMSEMAVENGKIDTIENYKAEQAACKGRK